MSSSFYTRTVAEPRRARTNDRYAMKQAITADLLASSCSERPLPHATPRQPIGLIQHSHLAWLVALTQYRALAIIDFVT